MSADPPPSAGLSRTAAAEPAADAASAPAAGSKRGASDDASAALNAVEHQHSPGSPMDDAPSAAVGSTSTPSSMALAAAQQSAAAAVSSAAPVHSDSAAATRKKQRVDQSVAAAPAVTTPPWSRLYSDALHSIFKFTRLPDLARLMSVSRRWGEAVITTPSIAAPVIVSSDAHLCVLLDSRLRRHVSKLLHPFGSPFALYPITRPAQLHLVSAQLPWLTHMSGIFSSVSDCYGAQAVCSAIARFQQLRSLDLNLAGSSVDNPSYPEACTRIMETVGRLNPATMRSLQLVLPRLLNLLSFAPLSALTQLRHFSFSTRDWLKTPPLTDDQIRDLRALTSLHQLTTPYKEEDETDMLVRMLQPGHALQWTTLGSANSPIQVTAPLASLLGSLPTLTTLKVWMRCADVQFFTQLIRLTDMELDGYGSRVDPAALVWSLRHCIQITRLKLAFVTLTSRHVEELLPAFPLLSFLTLFDLHKLESLRCLATPALAASLTILQLKELHSCPRSEPSQLFGLRSLQFVSISELARPLTTDHKAAFRVPSQIFPALHSSRLDSSPIAI